MSIARYYASASDRAIVIPGLPADNLYRFSVQAYRRVASDINPSGVILSPTVQSSQYRPATNAVFSGDLQGTIQGRGSLLVVQNLENIASDSILSTTEKPALVLTYNDMVSRYNAAVTATGGAVVTAISSARTTAINAKTALDSYLAGLTPAWNNTAVHTPIVQATFQAAWATMMTAVSNLENAIVQNLHQSLQLTSGGQLVYKPMSGGADVTLGSVNVTAETPVTAYLTNESATVTAFANGTVASYAPAFGKFVVEAGNVNINASFTLSTLANPQGLTIAYNGADYAITGGFDPSEDVASVTIRATGSGAYAGRTFDRIFTLAKLKGGYAIVAQGQGRPANDSTTGPLIFDENDDKLYRWNGTAWTAAVPAADVAGQLIENQLANGIVSESKLKIGVGSNMLIGAIPGLNPNRYIGMGWNPDGVAFYAGGEGGVFLSPAYGTNFPSGYASWTTPDGGTFAVSQQNNTPNSGTPGTTNVTDFHFKYPNTTGGGESILWPVEANKFYEFSAYTGAHRCTVVLFIDWLDANGTALGTTSISGPNANAGQGGISLDGYTRLVARGQAPATARNARLIARKSHTYAGQADSWMFLTHPMWAETTANATQAMPYNPPPAAILNAEMLVSNSILTRHLKADTIDASHIKADAIRTQHLLVSPNNINPDPLFKDEAFWTFNGSPGWYFEDAPGGSTANTIGYRKYLVLFSGTHTGAAQRTVTSKLIPFSGVGQKLRVRARTINWSNQDLWVYIEFFDGNSQYISGNYTPGSAAGSGVQTLSRQVDVPAGTNFLRVGVANSAGGSAYSGSLVVTDIKVDVAADASLIVDGSIVAGKIAANAVTADTIEAGAVTAAKIGVTQLSAISATIGLLRTADIGARLEIENNQIRVYYANNALAMRMGVW